MGKVYYSMESTRSKARYCLQGDVLMSWHQSENQIRLFQDSIVTELKVKRRDYRRTLDLFESSIVHKVSDETFIFCPRRLEEPVAIFQSNIKKLFIYYAIVYYYDATHENLHLIIKQDSGVLQYHQLRFTGTNKFDTFTSDMEMEHPLAICFDQEKGTLITICKEYTAVFKPVSYTHLTLPTIYSV
eukprot:TRINITY_DN10356_c0_g1_i1.p1 TRINITY_DN10356_c0_g1~~TRINITY_DN10356_c0_g1_i1.p1  ORF type:complete len:186 (+),score=9.17 TRINITY_DN10356_c0_g1_i1:94-651(+)